MIQFNNLGMSTPNVTKIIKLIKNANPIACTILSLLGGIRFPFLISSKNKNGILPPSNAGMGNKFNIPKFKLNMATK